MNQFKKSVLAVGATVISLASMAQTSAKVPNGWHLKDQKTSGLYGISLDQAYEFVKGKKSRTVTVAVIDSGIDTLHEDLRPVMWVNEDEIPGNGIDDDKNGYVDDVHGWNFLGGKDGRNVNTDSYEGARVYHQHKARFENLSDPSSLSPADQRLYETWKRAAAEVNKGMDAAELMFLQRIHPGFVKGDSVLRKELGKEEYTGKDLQAHTPTDKDAVFTRNLILGISAQNNNNFDITNKQLLDDIEGQIRKAESANTPPKSYRADVVGDDYNDINDRYYGNNDIMAGTAFHGTHVSGIIGAVRNNGIGVDGVADNVRIMTLRAVPDGDEHDKDIALAIRYAVDNGAKIINMSFGKSFSPQKEWVDDAVKYAESKGVLLVHAAGNSAANLDSSFNFPNGTMVMDGSRAKTWLTIGASGDPGNGGLSAGFSNYGQNEVDVFAPGVNIYSTIPGGNKYGNASGTSMAAPVTAGVAAFLWSYFPELTAEQLKLVLENSATIPTIKSNQPGGDEEVSFGILSRKGGIINAYEAAKLAAEITGKNAKKLKQTKKA